MQNAFIEFANVDSMIEYGNSLFEQVFSCNKKYHINWNGYKLILV